MDSRTRLKRGLMRKMQQRTVNEDTARSYSSGCSSKHSHPSKQIANGVKNALLARTLNWDEWFLIECCVVPYDCEFCGNWHLGNDRKKLVRLCVEQGYDPQNLSHRCRAILFRESIQ